MEKKERPVQWPHYKVMVKDTMVEYTPKFKDAEDAYNFSGDVKKEIFQVHADGTAFLVKKETGRTNV